MNLPLFRSCHDDGPEDEDEEEDVTKSLCPLSESGHTQTHALLTLVLRLIQFRFLKRPSPSTLWRSLYLVEKVESVLDQECVQYLDLE
jgi:hypothetical protein